MKISKIITKILASTVASAVAVGLCPDTCDCTNENKVVICAFKGRDFRTGPKIRTVIGRKISSTDRTENSDHGPVRSTMPGAPFSLEQGIRFIFFSRRWLILALFASISFLTAFHWMLLAIVPDISMKVIT